ncbi:MAG: type IX secretion system membrane protein PorP/SprF [Bacteroidales bacterium]|nr:type IX secretion system membrane protein PorP/SprF [Bacteroidales bacterium]
MKYFLSVIIFVCFTFSILAQSVQVHEQYLIDRFLLNPALTGLGEGTKINLTHKQQWVGFDNAPHTSFLSFNSRPETSSIGLGGYIYNDKNGPNQIIGAQFTFAYHLILAAKRFDQTILSMALSFNGDYHVLDESKFNKDIYDPIITYTKQSTFVPDFNAGLVLSHTSFMFGASADNLAQSPNNIYNRKIEGNQKIFYNFHTSYIFDLDVFELKPLVNVRTNLNGHNQMELVAKFNYQYGKKIKSNAVRLPNEFFVGFAYKHTLDRTHITPLSLQPFFGMKIASFTFAYHFEMGLTAIQLYNFGTHQISVGLNFVNDKTLNFGRSNVPINNSDF